MEKDSKMITRGRPKKRTEDTDMEDKETTPVEEIEMIEEMIDVYKRQTKSSPIQGNKYHGI